MVRHREKGETEGATDTEDIMEIEWTWLGVRGQEEAIETPGLGGDDINRGRRVRNRFGALCRGRNVMWLEVELL